MQEPEAKTKLGALVARPETIEKAKRFHPFPSMVRENDEEATRLRCVALHYVARNRRPYMPLIEKWQEAEQ